jgi:RND family efflux transporter MFP subunit
LLLAGTALGCRGTVAEPEKTPPAPVKWLAARQLFIEEWTEVVGTTQPLPSFAAQITAPVAGQVVSVLRGPKSKAVLEGQHVKKGDVIGRLDPRVAEANRDKAKASLKELDDQERRGKVAVDLAQIELNRLRKLKDQGVTVAQTDVEKAQLTLKDAQLQLEALKSKRESGLADLAALEVQLKLTTLTAPIDGQLGRLLVNPGQTLAAGAVVADIINIDKRIDVLCFVPPAVANHLKKGQPVRIGGIDEKVPANLARVEGKIEFIADQAEMDTGNFAVKVRFPNDVARLRANTTIRLRVLTAPGRAALTIPESALFEDKDPPEVVVVEDVKEEKVQEEGKEPKEITVGTARRLRAKVGVRDRVLHVVEILGLDDREKKWKGNFETALFVIENGQGLESGDKVKQEEEEEEE